MSILRNESIKYIIPAVIGIIGLMLYLVLKTPEQAPSILSYPGKPLAAYHDLYPVVSHDGVLSLDTERFMAAVDHFLANEAESRKAVADLIYLGTGNNVLLQLKDDEKARYQKLSGDPMYSEMASLNDQRDIFFSTYKAIVNGVGETLSGTPVEIVLHDTRNPLKSVKALQNPISGRKLNDPTTNFGLELIKNYAINAHESNYVSYLLQLKDGRDVKSTTIPIVKPELGLIGFICINIDISKLKQSSRDAAYVDTFLENFTSTIPNSNITEILENSKRKH